MQGLTVKGAEFRVYDTHTHTHTHTNFHNVTYRLAEDEKFSLVSSREVELVSNREV